MMMMKTFLKMLGWGVSPPPSVEPQRPPTPSTQNQILLCDALLDLSLQGTSIVPPYNHVTRLMKYLRQRNELAFKLKLPYRKSIVCFRTNGSVSKLLADAPPSHLTEVRSLSQVLANYQCNHTRLHINALDNLAHIISLMSLEHDVVSSLWEAGDSVVYEQLKRAIAADHKTLSEIHFPMLNPQ